MPVESFDRRHARPVGVRRRHQTRVDRHAVDEHGARPALPFAAPFLRPRQRAVLAQHVEQTLERMDIQLRPLSVDHEPDHVAARIFSGVAGISRRSIPALRIALITAGAGPSIGISPTPLAPNGPWAYAFSRITTSIFGVSSVVGIDRKRPRLN